MSDSAPFQLYIHHCPEASVTEVVAVLNAHGLAQDWDWRDGEVQTLEIGACYGCNDTRLDEAREIVEDLIATAPGCAFQAWQDPKWEWPGEIYLFTPALGLFSTECDSFGRPIITPGQLKRTLHALPATISRGEVVDRLSSLTGQAWLDELHRLRGPGISIPGES